MTGDLTDLEAAVLQVISVAVSDQPANDWVRVADIAERVVVDGVASTLSVLATIRELASPLLAITPILEALGPLAVEWELMDDDILSAVRLTPFGTAFFECDRSRRPPLGLLIGDLRHRRYMHTGSVGATFENPVAAMPAIDPLEILDPSSLFRTSGRPGSVRLPGGNGRRLHLGDLAAIDGGAKAPDGMLRPLIEPIGPSALSVRSNPIWTYPWLETTLLATLGNLGIRAEVDGTDPSAVLVRLERDPSPRELTLILESTDDLSCYYRLDRIGSFLSRCLEVFGSLNSDSTMVKEWEACLSFLSTKTEFSLAVWETKSSL